MVHFCLFSPPSIIVRVDLLPHPTGALRNASSPLKIATPQSKTSMKTTKTTMKTTKTPAPFEVYLRPTPENVFTQRPPDLRPPPTPTPTPAPALSRRGSRTTISILRTPPTSTTEGGTPPRWLLWLQRKSTRWRPDFQHDKLATNDGIHRKKKHAY
jgi:hypothetical protein